MGKTIHVFCKATDHPITKEDPIEAKYRQLLAQGGFKLTRESSDSDIQAMVRYLNRSPDAEVVVYRADRKDWDYGYMTTSTCLQTGDLSWMMSQIGKKLILVPDMMEFGAKLGLMDQIALATRSSGPAVWDGVMRKQLHDTKRFGYFASADGLIVIMIPSDELSGFATEMTPMYHLAYGEPEQPVQDAPSAPQRASVSSGPKPPVRAAASANRQMNRTMIMIVVALILLMLMAGLILAMGG